MPAQNAATGGVVATTAADKPPFKQEELDQLLAPVALYTDDLLSQVLMASTYPVEIVMAERWLKEHASLKGDALAVELEKQPWDPAVKSLINVPPVLTMMSDKLDWTVRLGDAFLQDQKKIMDTVQKLRTKAQAQGNLKSSKEQTVTIQQQVVKIEQADPQVIYVPTYDPSAVYGVWAYPAYPPYYYYPPGYVARPGMAFAAGVAIGVAWGYAWGNCDWNGGDVNINVDRNTQINNRIDRGKYPNARGENGAWRHDATHRQGAPYRDRATAQRLGASTGSDAAARARDQYRGRTGGAGVGNNMAAGGAQNRPSQGTNRPAQGTNRPATSNNMFNDVNRGGNATRAASDRGYNSRSNSSGASRPARSSGGGSRGGGGGRRR